MYCPRPHNQQMYIPEFTGQFCGLVGKTAGMTYRLVLLLLDCRSVN